jgi:hypothetical protein
MYGEAGRGYTPPTPVGPTGGYDEIPSLTKSDPYGLGVGGEFDTAPKVTELPDARDAAKIPTVKPKAKPSSVAPSKETKPTVDTTSSKATPATSDPGYMPSGAGYTTINGKMPTPEQQKEQRIAAAEAISAGKDPQTAVNTVVATQKDKDTTTAPSTKNKNVASTGRTEADIQADINKELAGGTWTEKANELVKERDSARANEGGGSGGDSGSSDSGSSGSGGGGCCFIMLEARYGDGTMDEVVRRYRDEHMTDRNRRGYYKVSEVLVPLMRKSPTIKWLVTKTFADPLVSYGKYYYGQNKHGVLYSPVKSLWMKLFDTVGGDTEFIRENGEVV